MKFVKGVMLGTAMTATAWMLCSEGMVNGKKIMKKCKKLSKQMWG